MYFLKNLSIAALLINTAISAEPALSNLQKNDCVVLDLMRAPQVDQREFEVYNALTTTWEGKQSVISAIEDDNFPIDLGCARS